MSKARLLTVKEVKSNWASNRKGKNENPVQIGFANLDQTSRRLLSGGSLSAYLKHSAICEKFPDNNQPRCTIKLKVSLHGNSSAKHM